MTEFKNELGTVNTVGVADDIGKDMIKDQKEQLDKEIEGYERLIEQKQKEHDNFREQLDIAIERWDLELENFGMLPEKYSHKVHKIPRYWELAKKEKEFAIRMERLQNEQTLVGFLAEIDMGKAQMAELVKQRDKLDEQEGD